MIWNRDLKSFDLKSYQTLAANELNYSRISFDTVA